ncbi:hypothetical protein QBC39DRAFT_146051 [Podospora conica]|nr:hypothetical protein QBC39DRAFT_146051 [Schizothecium conicum]
MHDTVTTRSSPGISRGGVTCIIISIGTGATTRYHRRRYTGKGGAMTEGGSRAAGTPAHGGGGGEPRREGSSPDSYGLARPNCLCKLTVLRTHTNTTIIINAPMALNSSSKHSSHCECALVETLSVMLGGVELMRLRQNRRPLSLRLPIRKGGRWQQQLHSDGTVSERTQLESSQAQPYPSERACLGTNTALATALGQDDRPFPSPQPPRAQNKAFPIGRSRLGGGGARRAAIMGVCERGGLVMFTPTSVCAPLHCYMVHLVVVIAMRAPCYAMPCDCRPAGARGDGFNRSSSSADSTRIPGRIASTWVYLPLSGEWRGRRRRSSTSWTWCCVSCHVGLSRIGKCWAPISTVLVFITLFCSCSMMLL